MRKNDSCWCPNGYVRGIRVPVAHLRVNELCDYAAGARKRLRIAISLQHKLVDVACAKSF